MKFTPSPARLYTPYEELSNLSNKLNRHDKSLLKSIYAFATKSLSKNTEPEATVKPSKGIEFNG